MIIQHRPQVLLIAAFLTAVLSAAAPAADNADKTALVAQPAASAPAISPSAAPRNKFVALRKYFLHLRCIHLGCQGVHVLGVGY